MCPSSLRFLRYVSLFTALLCLVVGTEDVASAQGSLPRPQPLAPGAEALGRGGAFAAKADSPLALEYNVAGLAQLRGTQVLIDTSLFLPTESTWCKEWNREAVRPCYGGLFAVSTDFGVLRRWTLTAGLRVPEYVTAYGLFTNLSSTQDPGAALIPFRWPPALFLSPSLSVSVLAHRRVALGLTLEDAMAIALSACPYGAQGASAEPCTGPSQQERSLMNPVVQLGLLTRLGTERSLVTLGLSARSAPNLGLRPVLSNPSVDLPWTVRAGVRYLRQTDRGSSADLELDGVAQAWTPIDSFGQQKPRDSLGLRLGGSYGVAVGGARLTARAGFLFDWLLRPSTPSREDRSYSLSGTVGLGAEVGRFVAQLGYGYVSDQIRTTGLLAGDTRLASHQLSLSALFRT